MIAACLLTTFVVLTAAEPRQRPDTPVGQLLDQLERRNASDYLHDPWLTTMKEIVELGPQAVPELCAELDATDDDKMLRCLGFMLRAIGDPRAVPALVRAVPKTLVPSCSDYGARAGDETLAAWAQQHELPGDKNTGLNYDFSRSVREIFGAIRKLTGHEMQEEELFHTFLSGVESQRRAKQRLFHRTAAGWAAWWDEHAGQFTADPQYAHANLPPLEPDTTGPPRDAVRYKTTGGGSNWMMESVLAPEAETVFRDMDTGRVGKLPEKWRRAEDIAQHMDEILAWARDEGFDLMGSEYTASDGRRAYALRAIGMDVWELDPGRWKESWPDVTIGEFKADGTRAGEWLMRRGGTTETFDLDATASFFFITADHTPGLLWVGIPVYDDSLKPGGISQGDNELRPIAFRKGRRFGFTDFEELPEE
ncbi:MAG: hypothetical protein DWQ37_02330 [Planctomycetota bacterium]|nr:MAG: hypothetical protein DWQ37_02330 [Planctomycetota bacterium]